MTTVRRLLTRHRALALWLVGAALLVRMLVPAGYMLASTHGSVTVELCSGYGPVTAATTMAMPGTAHHRHDHGKAEQPCAFAALAAPALAGADPVLLAAAIAFVMAAPFLAARPVEAAAPAFLRPPPRGPPLLP